MSTTGHLCPIYIYKIILNVKNVFDNHFMRNIKPYEEYSNLNANDIATPAGNQKKQIYITRKHFCCILRGDQVVKYFTNKIQYKHTTIAFIKS